MTTQIPESWASLLADETRQPYWAALQAYLAQREAQGAIIYPPAPLRYAALAAVAPQQVKVVILGQDPYHGAGQAHGLSFSVPDGVKIPPSLRNIFKELSLEFGCNAPQSGNLGAWAQQGVLLLNSVLSVEEGKAGAHAKQGWERFTDAIVTHLSARYDGIVFLLWGSYAESKAALIDATKHCILRSPHPSPLSAHRGFLGNGHFLAANHYLTERGRGEIAWCQA